MIRRAVSRKGIDDVLGEHDHFARMGTRMNNIFWIIGVIVVVIAVLGFFGLR
jgi:UDP-N-acetylmuramyl pentapeptide phosphotransferase/UDP-N-acetylglucosamine-1-phosphate transferase